MKEDSHKIVFSKCDSNEVTEEGKMGDIWRRLCITTNVA